MDADGRGWAERAGRLGRRRIEGFWNREPYVVTWLLIVAMRLFAALFLLFLIAAIGAGCLLGGFYGDLPASWIMIRAIGFALASECLAMLRDMAINSGRTRARLEAIERSLGQGGDGAGRESHAEAQSPQSEEGTTAGPAITAKLAEIPGRLICDKCGARLRLKNGAGPGATGRCPKCGAAVRI